MELYTQHAPRTCQNFLELARLGYYDGTCFHRVIKDFMVQGGDPTGTGRGGESIYGSESTSIHVCSHCTHILDHPNHHSSSRNLACLHRVCVHSGKFEDEISRDLKHTGAGVLSMANAGPHTNGSQFFLSLAPTPWLDGKHTIFGRVSRGLGVLQRMGSVATGGAEDRPLADIVLLRAFSSLDVAPPPALLGE